MICLEESEITTEEADLLTRSSKKVKIGDADVEGGNKGSNSYIDSLMGNSFVATEVDESMHESEYISDDEDDDCDEADCPVIKLSTEEKKRIRKPWQQTLIGVPLKIVGIAALSLLMPTLGAYVFGTEGEV